MTNNDKTAWSDSKSMLGQDILDEHDKQKPDLEDDDMDDTVPLFTSSVVVAKLKQSAGHGTTIYQRQDTLEILYTQKRTHSLRVLVGKEFYRGNAAGKDCSNQKPYAFLKNLSIDFYDEKGDPNNIWEHKYLYTRDHNPWEPLFAVNGHEFKLVVKNVMWTKLHLFTYAASKTSTPIATYRGYIKPRNGVEALFTINAAHVYEGPEASAPSDALIVNGLPTSVLDHYMIALPIFRRRATTYNSGYAWSSYGYNKKD